MPTYYVEIYAPDGSTCNPDIREHADLADAYSDASARIGRFVGNAPEWMPDAETRPDGIPDEAIPIGAWHESNAELCGGVAIWEVK